jgi:hypothetical protein
VESEMTEEEFKALLKVQGNEMKLVVEPETVWTVQLVTADGTVSMERWASSHDKEMALEILANKYFKGEDADIK